MKEFQSSYDEGNDDLFVYLKGKKSKGAVEAGNFVFDFDENENLVGIQIFEASQVFSKMLSKIIEVTKLKEIRADIVNFRNMATLRIYLNTETGQETANIIIPQIKEHSPALSSY